MTSHPRATLLLAGLVVALGAALTGCGAGDTAPAASPSPSGGTSKGSPAVTVGDCRIEAASGLPTDAEVVPCAEQHDEEVFLTVPVKGSSFSQTAVDEAAAACVGDAFTSFVGVSKAESALDVYTIAPTGDTWDAAGDNVVHCILFDAAGPVEGSLAGAAR